MKPVKYILLVHINSRAAIWQRNKEPKSPKADIKKFYYAKSEEKE